MFAAVRMFATIKGLLLHRAKPYDWEEKEVSPKPIEVWFEMNGMDISMPIDEAKLLHQALGALLAISATVAPGATGRLHTIDLEPTIAAPEAG